MTNSVLVTVMLLLLFSLSSCNLGDANLIDLLTPPVIIDIKNDSIIVVQDINGEKYTLNAFDKVNYRTAFLNIGDTLKLK